MASKWDAVEAHFEELLSVRDLPEPLPEQLITCMNNGTRIFYNTKRALLTKPPGSAAREA